jgi:hypothetical protein
MKRCPAVEVTTMQVSRGDEGGSIPEALKPSVRKI